MFLLVGGLPTGNWFYKLKKKKNPNQLSHWFKQDTVLEAAVPINISGAWRSVTVSLKNLNLRFLR